MKFLESTMNRRNKLYTFLLRMQYLNEKLRTTAVDVQFTECNERFEVYTRYDIRQALGSVCS